MFERMTDRVRGAAEAKARVLAAELAERAGEMVPPAIRVSAQADGVRLTGRGLRRRMALEPALRSLWRRLM